ncbi:hypothetical protein [Lysinibacter sp. HNR]|uniref:hypothetical protein n=1 Tax=Lysinibacter sp. HNR TaxID=3031408 RepID=UPI002436062C|nr:hypothetical protein [Lysinibacter sp. HNR]WGD36756.1 hypothetical protein FrondiHNR_09850 [Lysinibacter sp. HNR]
MDDFLTLLGFLDSLIAVLAPVAIILVAAIGVKISGVERFFLFAAVRRARKVLHRSIPTSDKKTIKALQTTLVFRYLLPKLKGEELTPADLVSWLIKDKDRTQYDDLLGQLHLLLQLAIAPERQSAVARVLWADNVDAVRHELRLVSDYLDRDYIAKIPVPIEASQRVFADTVSLFVGANVLVDGMASRLGALTRVFVNHRDAWDGPELPHPPADEHTLPALRGRTNRHAELLRAPSRFDVRHRGYDVSRLNVQREVVSSGIEPGDHDGRIFSLKAARQMVDEVTGKLVVELETHESCTVLSEQHPRYRSRNLGSDLSAAASASVFEVDGANAFVCPEERPLTQLNTCVSFVSHTERGVHLLLAKRTNPSALVDDTLSVTAEHTFEHSRHGEKGDGDIFGSPSPLNSVLREVREEFGFTLDPNQVSPVAVFASNAQHKPVDSGADNAHEGVLGASVCFIAQISLNAAEIEHQRALHSDWAEGRFDRDSIAEIEIPLAGSSSETTIADAACRYVLLLNGMLGQLDQSAIITALYTGAHFYGSDTMRQALLTHSPVPWGALPWETGTFRGPRIIRHPKVFFGHRYGVISELQVDWSAAYSGLVPVRGGEAHDEKPLAV